MTRFLITTALLAFTVGAHANPAANVDPVIELGRKIAELNCASCHAISTEGKSTHREAPPLRELSRKYPIDALEEAFVEGIYSGHPDMPMFEASPEQVSALLAYIDSIQAKP